VGCQALGEDFAWNGVSVEGSVFRGFVLRAVDYSAAVGGDTSNCSTGVSGNGEGSAIGVFDEHFGDDEFFCP